MARQNDSAVPGAMPGLFLRKWCISYAVLAAHCSLLLAVKALQPRNLAAVARPMTLDPIDVTHRLTRGGCACATVDAAPVRRQRLLQDGQYNGVCLHACDNSPQQISAMSNSSRCLKWLINL